ncbi:MAG: group 1 truncated hemoglobin [Candidatus Hydrogenedentes bacterium]|nr:group 1 truncated hemoglobin [Candidatus Hydrogenedentota bacterium]
MESLYFELGGSKVIERIVDDLYNRVLRDQDLAPFFANIDPVLLRHKFCTFMNTVAGGPYERSGLELRSAHFGAVNEGLTDSHVDKFVAHFSEVLNEAAIPSPLVEALIARVNEFRGDVLGY